MVSQALIQKKVAYGLSKAASKLGAEGKQFRPTSLLNPLQQPTYATLMMEFYKDSTFMLAAPNAWGKPDRYIMTDTTDIAVGDILTVNNEAVFISCMEAMMPPYATFCTTTVSISAGQGGDGAPDSSGVCAISGYIPGFNGGAFSSASLAEGWPAFLGPPKRGEKLDITTPGLLRPGEFELRLPKMPGFSPSPGMLVTDASGMRYQISAVNNGPYGSQCVINMVQA